jgi:hypothetical protein
MALHDRSLCSQCDIDVLQCTADADSSWQCQKCVAAQVL